MGSCLSSNKHKNSINDAKVQETTTSKLLLSPEETVKEVLSSENSTLTVQDLNFRIPNSNKIKPHKENQHGLKTNVTTSDVSSCSLTKNTTISTVFSTSPDDNDLMHAGNKSPAMLPPRNRSFSSDIRTKMAKIREGARNGRANEGLARMIRSREKGQVMDRIDPRERRCRSPLMTRVGGGYAARPDLVQTLSCRRTNGSHCRVNNSGPKKKKWSAKESLESQVVSLECFIFL